MSDVKKRTKPKIDIDLTKVEALAANGLTQQQIADSLGISERTLQNRKRDSAEFADAIKRGRNKGIAFVTNSLMNKIKSGNVTAMIFYLKTQAGWRETKELEVSGDVFVPQMIELVALDETDCANEKDAD